MATINEMLEEYHEMKDRQARGGRTYFTSFQTKDGEVGNAVIGLDRPIKTLDDVQELEDKIAYLTTSTVKITNFIKLED